jgi:hypothetical protein
MKDSQGNEIKIDDTVISSDPIDSGMTFKVVELIHEHGFVTLLEIKREKSKAKLLHGLYLPFPFKPARRDSQLTILKSSLTKDEKLTKRTIKIIERGGRILIKKKGIGSFCYLGQWTCIQAGIDSAHWVKRDFAMEIFNLKWAFGLAKLYNCKVVVFYPKGKNS